MMCSTCSLCFLVSVYPFSSPPSSIKTVLKYPGNTNNSPCSHLSSKASFHSLESLPSLWNRISLLLFRFSTPLSYIPLRGNSACSLHFIPEPSFISPFVPFSFETLPLFLKLPSEFWNSFLLLGILLTLSWIG
jgi:hypothetical protein